jgi:homoserine dehydrogenase
MKNFKLALIGFGNVGQGLAEILRSKEATLAKQDGVGFSVVAISDFKLGSVAEPNGIDLEKALETVRAGGKLDAVEGAHHGWDALTTIRQSGADIMVELTYTDISTGEPATTHIKEALGLGQHVTTTNKGPVVLAARELEELAASKGVRFLYEGTVMSGTPTLSFAQKNLAGCTIRSVQGILNGTTNYMLTEMEKGMSYEEALDTAQKLGYAEAVPDADVQGHDALGKVVILSNLVLGADIKPADVPCEGITKITPDQIAEAAKQGKRYKLIGRAALEGDTLTASVKPVALPLNDPLAGVGGATNAITFETDLLGAVTVVGPGAGRLETGFSILADLIEIGRSA